MSEAKFTKEPWHIAVIKNIGEGRIVWDKINEPDLQLIADAWQLPDLRREIKELKVLNKEMYEALETIDETYKYRRIPDIRRKGHTILKDEIRGGAVFTYDDIKKVREALRKARGEEE